MALLTPRDRALRGLLALAVLVWVARSGASAQEQWVGSPAWGGGSVEIRADTLSASGRDTIEAQGHVVIVSDRFRLRADRATYRIATGSALAEGSVVVSDDAGNELECRRIDVNLQTQQGDIEHGSLRLAEDGYRVWGERFRKTGPNSYLVEEGGFTTCDGTWPSWKVEAKQVEVEVEGFLIGRNASFWVEGAPILYSPYVLFPVKRERQSGFLLPKLGFTGSDGIHFAARYYWVVADNADATLKAVYRSRRGWSEEVEARYVLADGHEGALALSHLDDRKERKQRYTVAGAHRSRFDDGSRSNLELNYLGDADYNRDLGDTLDDRGVDRVRSYALGTHDRESGTLYGFAQFFETLDNTQAEVLQTLPSLGLVGRETPLYGPFVWETTLRGARLWRAKGTRAERLEVLPSLGWQGGAGGMGVSARAGYRQNLYHMEDGLTARGAAGLEATSGLTLMREWGGFTHIVEPQLRFAWEEAGRGGTPPALDDADHFEHRAGPSLLIENRLVRRESGESLVSLDVEWRADVRDDERGLFRADADWTPSPAFRLAADGVYDADVEDRVLRWSTAADARDSRGDRLYASYRYLKEQASYADCGVEVALTDVLSFQYRNRYSTWDDRLLEDVYGLDLTHPCWNLLLSFSRNLRADEGRYERRYYAQLELKGLGRVGSMKGILPGQ